MEAERACSLRLLPAPSVSPPLLSLRGGARTKPRARCAAVCRTHTTGHDEQREQRRNAMPPTTEIASGASVPSLRNSQRQWPRATIDVSVVIRIDASGQSLLRRPRLDRDLWNVPEILHELHEENGIVHPMPASRIIPRTRARSTACSSPRASRRHDEPQRNRQQERSDRRTLLVRDREHHEHEEDRQRDDQHHLSVGFLDRVALAADDDAYPFGTSVPEPRAPAVRT